MQHTKGDPSSAARIARMTGNLDAGEVAAWLSELEDSGVFSRSQSDLIFSRRMVRDERERQEAAKRQAKHRAKSQPCHAVVTLESRGSSESHSDSESEKDPPSPREVAAPLVVTDTVSRTAVPPRFLVSRDGDRPARLSSLRPVRR